MSQLFILYATNIQYRIRETRLDVFFSFNLSIEYIMYKKKQKLQFIIVITVISEDQDYNYKQSDLIIWILRR